jgi:Flp pilus assembly pilin Flp
MWQNAVFARCRNDCADESVATAIECRQMAAGISVVIIATVNVIDTRSMVNSRASRLS